MAVVCYFVIVGHNDHPVFEIDLSKSSESQAAKVIAQFVTFKKCILKSKLMYWMLLLLLLLFIIVNLILW